MEIENTNVKAHKTIRHLEEVVITPEHVKRKESKEFRASKRRLKQDGHYHCYVCGNEKKLQVHHYGAEWSLENNVDFGKLKEFVEEWDVYGYGRLLNKQPIETVDDIRNMMVLCQEHHTGGTKDGSANGIHNITFPAWISQKLDKIVNTSVPLADPTNAKNLK